MTDEKIMATVKPDGEWRQPEIEIVPRRVHNYIAHCYEEVPRTYLFDELDRKSVV